MIDLNSKFPIELNKVLNEFNEKISTIRNEFTAEANSLLQRDFDPESEKTVFRYEKKNTDFYFQITYYKSSNLISWEYYPGLKTSVNSTKFNSLKSRAEIYSKMRSSLIRWEQNIRESSSIGNPLAFFEHDNFIEFYSTEILEEIPITEEEKRFPLSSPKRAQAIALISIQTKFLEKELEQIEDKTSEEYRDLELSKNLLVKIKEELPRTTAAEVKRNWSLSLAFITKWCGDKFRKFLIADKQNGFDFSRSLGSFIGGVFGIPKIGE